MKEILALAAMVAVSILALKVILSIPWWILAGVIVAAIVAGKVNK
jgi:hypothetical protein